MPRAPLQLSADFAHRPPTTDELHSLMQLNRNLRRMVQAEETMTTLTDAQLKEIGRLAVQAHVARTELAAHESNSAKLAAREARARVGQIEKQIATIIAEGGR